MKDLLSYIVDKAETSKARYELHSFDSGAIMVDIWIDDNFYVIQIDGDIIGISLITQETISFDTIPDTTFRNASEFRTKFESIFSTR